MPGFEANDDNSTIVTIKNNDDSAKRKRKNLGVTTAKNIGTLEKRVESSIKNQRMRKKKCNSRGSQSGDNRAFHMTNENLSNKVLWKGLHSLRNN